MKYDIGTITVTNGSPAIVGASTRWASNTAAGQLLTVVGSGVFYEIGAVTDDTHLTLTSNYVDPLGGTVTAGLMYTIVQGFTPNFNIPYTDIGDVQTASIIKRALMTIDTMLIDYLSGRIVGQTINATTSTQQLTKGRNSIVNLVNGVLNLTLPASPLDGEFVGVTDASASYVGGGTPYTAEQQNWHISAANPTTEKLDGGVSYLTMDQAGAKMKLFFNGTRQTWEAWP